MPDGRVGHESRNQVDAWEEALRQVVESGQDSSFVVFARADRADEYVQFYLHNHLFHAEVGSREWGSDQRPLASEAVVRLSAMGFIKTPAHRNYLRDDLPPEPVSLAQLTLSIFAAAYDVPEEFPVEIRVNGYPTGRAERAAEAPKSGQSPGRSGTHSKGGHSISREHGSPPTVEPWQAVLPEGHDCRVDDLAYNTVHDWWEAHRGRVPIQAAGWLSRYMRTHNCTFAVAFAAATGPGAPLILIK